MKPCQSDSDHIFVVRYADKLENDEFTYNLQCEICQYKLETTRPMRKNIPAAQSNSDCQQNHHDWNSVIPPLTAYHRWCWNCNTSEERDTKSLPDISNGSMICSQCTADGSQDLTVWKYYGNLLFANMIRYQCSKCWAVQNFHGKLPHDRLDAAGILMDSTFIYGHGDKIVQRPEMKTFIKNATIGSMSRSCSCDFCQAEQSLGVEYIDVVGGIHVQFASHSYPNSLGWKFFQYEQGSLTVYLDVCPKCIVDHKLPSEKLRDAFLADEASADKNNHSASTIAHLQILKSYNK